MAPRSEKPLPSLPKSDSEYWQGEINLIDLKTKYRAAKCSHVFAQEGREARCQKCGAGFFLNVDDYVEDGHLYSKGQLII